MEVRPPAEDPPSRPRASFASSAQSSEDAHGLEGGSSPVSEELAIALYEQMVLSRELDRRIIALQRSGRVVQHSSAIGEEAAVVGAAAAMRETDWVFLGSREVAAALWRGMPLAAYAHHVLGTRYDAAKGRCAPDPPFWKPALVPSVSPLVGTHIPHAVGVCWAARTRRQDVASLVFFGEGATSTGDFHTGLNFAGVTRAPLIALCRNNGWAASTPASRQTASGGFAVKAVAYGLRGVSVDGSDVLAVFSAVSEARARASAGECGTLIEAVTAPPREGEDDQVWSKRDPIARMEAYLRSRALWTDDSEQRLGEEVRADIERALAIAEAESAAPAQSMFDEVYAKLPLHLCEQREELLAARSAGG